MTEFAVGSYQSASQEEDSNEDEMDIHLFNDALDTLYKWVANEGFNNETDFNAQDVLVKHIFKLAKAFNMEDIHMEPPAPTHVFSEAAMQTPAPLPVLAMPIPPPIPVTSAPAASTSSKPGPPSRPSFAKAAAKTLHPTAPPFVQGPPCAPQPQPKATQGPVPVLHQDASSLHINSACFTNSGITCATASVPIQSDLNIIEAMLPPKITRSRASLPSSQSFIKIIDIPYFKPGTTEHPNRQEIGNQLIPSPILVNMIEHTQFVHNSPKADSGTFWIDLMDSQQGTLASSLIG
ncbi:hypothetical protein P691DRAFT_766509 [Macrolepiota fuliginosa MF-IS2]|uniref:Uncharacterized protein n=1 Tax=Macrolepiota fuliginosa MF-IS2 TaxID=1400762 RepID=A0A9P5WYL7_9AGAR|nr:hypothetical protein P691DRAFT_766509 [Macrolepiota fuliginosa MF-IS2]